MKTYNKFKYDTNYRTTTFAYHYEIFADNYVYEFQDFTMTKEIGWFFSFDSITESWYCIDSTIDSLAHLEEFDLDWVCISNETK